MGGNFFKAGVSCKCCRASDTDEIFFHKTISNHTNSQDPKVNTKSVGLLKKENLLNLMTTNQDNFSLYNSGSRVFNDNNFDNLILQAKNGLDATIGKVLLNEELYNKLQNNDYKLKSNWLKSDNKLEGMDICKNEVEYILEKTNFENINDDHTNLKQVFNTDKYVGSNLEKNYISNCKINKIRPISNTSLTLANTNNFKLRKQSFTQSNSNMPLEIINELNGEGQIVMTPYTEGINLKLNNEIKENSIYNNNLENKDFNLDSKAKNLIKGQKRIKFMNEDDNNREDQIYENENVNFEFNNFNPGHYSARSGKSKIIELMKSNNINHNKYLLSKSSDIIKTKTYKTNLNKSENMGGNNLKLKNEVSKIIKPQKFHNMQNDEMILHGEFLKLSTDVNKSNKYDVQSYAYDTKFCVLTKSEFKYYNSKENYFRLLKPNFCIQITNLIAVNYIDENFIKNIPIKKLHNNKQNSQNYHFYLKILNVGNTNSNISLYTSQTVNKTNNTDLNLNETHSMYAKSFINNDNNCNLKKSGEQTNRTHMNHKSDEKLNNLIIFASSNQNIVNIWLNVLDFLKIKNS